MELYIAVLHRLVETCKYGDLTKEMLWDRLAVGICDTKLSAQLQMDSALNYESAMKKGDKVKQCKSRGSICKETLKPIP